MSHPGGPPPSDTKRRVSKAVTVKVVNPVVRWLLEHGLAPRTHALLETTGRKSGQPRRVPVGNGLRGDTFWIVTEHGRRADYVRNIEKDPRVRVKVGRRWRAGTAHVLLDDDVEERFRMLRRPVNDALVRAVGTEQLTVRIDLDP
jgi:deazaflavin-dependent oxidoreductase (nitroreductase family)